jgi:Ion channel
VTPVLLVSAYVLAVAGVVVAVLRAAGEVGEGEGRLMSAVVVALGRPAIAVGVVRSLRPSGRVRVDAVTGVLAIYMLLGMPFAFVYGAIDRLGDSPVFDNRVVALTTVGYGDLTTRTDLGHTLAVFDALLGQIYLVTVVSLIVGDLDGRNPDRPDHSDATPRVLAARVLAMKSSAPAMSARSSSAKARNSSVRRCSSRQAASRRIRF